MNSVCGICFEKTEDLFRLNNSFLATCAKCLKRLNIGNQSINLTQGAQQDFAQEPSEQECPICGKYFARRYSFMNHVRNHSAERKHVCRFCQKAFTQAANLRNHERIHTNERPYSCSVCQKAFTQITNLNNHLRLHTGERPFQCPVEGCNKAFAQVLVLNSELILKIQKWFDR
ncbi:zinc finger protein 883-like [Ctenocephalides felis]|uniref:zinc finger protein 883-like n=1 Tax=Ctenocephalides felis TaxID=7515 RepID=UPI000E6E43B1|nr:zinc finger protein 883-like [Ctenocephalides felis]